MMTSGTAATTVAAVQMRAVPCDVAGNLDKALGFLEEASSRGARLTLFPELFNTGYFIGPELFDLAETDDGRTVTWMREQAARREMLVAGSIPERRGDRLLNTLFVAEPGGGLHRYAKRQPVGLELAAFDHGDDEAIAETSLGRIGRAVCADLSWGKTLLRPLAGNVDLLLFSQASSSLKPLGRLMWRQERRRGRPFLGGAVKAIGAPMVLAGLVGPVQRIMRWYGVSLRGGTWITNAEGRALANVPFDEEGVAVAAVSIGSTGGDPSSKVFRDPGFGSDLLGSFVPPEPSSAARAIMSPQCPLSAVPTGR
jgi:predicted amidohydrolase